jgi:hypothetical protein
MAVNLQDSRISVPPEGSGDGSLTITGAAVADSSPYQCHASNPAGTVSSTSRQLRVLEPSQVDRRPEDLPGSSDGLFQTDYGTTVSIPCQVTREDGTTVVYRWYRDGVLVETINIQPGDLEREGVREAERGRYRCVVEIAASGVGGQPLEEVIGALTLGVGEPPSNPSASTSPLITTITTHTLTLSWTPPTFTGNLPLTGYVVEVLLLGNLLCPQLESEWALHQTVDDSNAEQTIVSGLVPYQEYRVRIRATNSAYQSDASTVEESVWTLPSAPSAPPSHVEVISGGLQALLVSWEPPADCLTFGGPLTDYTVSYRISSEFPVDAVAPA